jgi:hypothetical protein
VSKTIVGILLAILVIGSFASVPRPADGDTEFQLDNVWVQLRGFTTQWGGNAAAGWLGVMAGIFNDTDTASEWAMVNAMWSNETNRPNLEPWDEIGNGTGTFTFSMYTARLVNPSMVATNYSGYDFYVSGLWNVSKITTTLTISETGALVDFERTAEPLVTSAPGVLSVQSMTFELKIEGVDTLTGSVRMAIESIEEINFFDVTGDGKVDIQDLVTAAKKYGAVAGTTDYNFDLDFNLEGIIGLGTLVTIAANIEG